MRSVRLAQLVLCLATILLWIPTINAAKAHATLDGLPGVPRNSDILPANDSKNTDSQSNPSDYRMEAAVIRPYRQATISSEVSGVIEELYLQEGDPVVGGQVIFEISKEFFELTVERAQERLWALEIALEQARADLGIQEYLFSHNAGTRSQLVKARSEAEIAEHRVNEAKIDLAFALRDLQSCRVKAPFAGHIISLYNKQHESVQRFDQLFLMADTSKVYAVVNAPEQILTQLRKGLPAIFVRPDGERYMGVVARISKPIDPSSKTKRVHVLINNAASKLEMGMLGAVRLMGEKE